MKKILVTGCNGQLGRAINEVYKADVEAGKVTLINTDVGVEGVKAVDITDLAGVLKFVEEEKPEVIINCAAFTNVNGAETAEELCYKINAIGPRNLAIAAKRFGAKLVHVSTDYVFDGTNTVPYTEFDSPKPLGAYGRTKYAGEEFVKQFGDKFFIIRTAWLYGDGKNFVKTMLSLAETHDEVSVVGDQIGSPTSAMELARCIYALEPTDNFGIFHGTCEGFCSWADFTEEIFRLAGKDTKVKHITTDEYPTPAKRPAYSVLDNMMLRLTTDFRFKDWKDAIAEYMK